MMNCLREFITDHAPDPVFINLVNINNKLKKRPGKLSQYNKDIYIVTDGKKNAYSPRRSRLGRYYFGIDKQCESLAKDYLLDNITFKKGDVVIDCGANNGEIGIWANHKGLTYFAFEPEPLESQCCDLNNFDGQKKTIRKGLWFENTTIHWHSKPETADSSIIEMPETEDVQSIQTTTLSDFVNEEKIDNIRLFKLEAEGAEPEVLQGALPVLDKIDYMAVDCGYERGMDKKHTFMEIYNTLTDHNFEIVAAEFWRVVFLFKRRGVK